MDRRPLPIHGTIVKWGGRINKAGRRVQTVCLSPVTIEYGTHTHTQDHTWIQMPRKVEETVTSTYKEGDIVHWTGVVRHYTKPNRHVRVSIKKLVVSDIRKTINND